MRWIASFFFLISASRAIAAPACPAGVAVAHFRVEALMGPAARPVPLDRVNRLRQGDIVRFIPSDPRPGEEIEKGRVSLLITARENDELRLLDTFPAKGRHEWRMPYDVNVVALAYGPQGFDEEKVQSIASKDRELMNQLAEYSEKTTQTEVVLGALSGTRPHDDRSLEGALQGLAVGSTGARLDRTASADQQTLTLIQALNPALSTLDPLAPAPEQRWQQSATLAASLAGLFLGNTVAFAGGGATLFLNLRTLLFPKTDLRSALLRDANEPVLCSAAAPNTSRTRLAYLWARRLPNGRPPQLRLNKPAHVARALVANIPVSASDQDLAAASRAWRWKLVDDRGVPVPVTVTAPATERVLRIASVPANLADGHYTLFAEWDWDEVRVEGDVFVHTIPDLSSVRLSPESADRVIASTGRARVELHGPSLYFLQNVDLLRTGDLLAKPISVPFAIREEGDTAEAEIDTNALQVGNYTMTLRQQGGAKSDVSLLVNPPAPVIEGLPFVVASGSAEEVVPLRGQGLERIERAWSPSAKLEWDAAAQALRVKDSKLREGAALDVFLQVKGRQQPLVLAKALQVAGPKAKVAKVTPATQEAGVVERREGEVDGARPASFSIQVQNLPANPSVKVRCRGRSEPIRSDVRVVGKDLLFLTVPEVSVADCELQAVIHGGEPITLGRVVSLPNIEKFELSGDSAGDGLFSGMVLGHGLETIERTGWDPVRSETVQALPVPEGGKQRLQIVMPWPSPAPHAPLMIWLRGESEPRKTTVKY